MYSNPVTHNWMFSILLQIYTCVFFCLFQNLSELWLHILCWNCYRIRNEELSWGLRTRHIFLVLETYLYIGRSQCISSIQFETSKETSCFSNSATVSLFQGLHCERRWKKEEVLQACWLLEFFCRWCYFLISRQTRSWKKVLSLNHYIVITGQ